MASGEGREKRQRPKAERRAGRDPSLLLRMTAQRAAELQAAPVFTFDFCVLTCYCPSERPDRVPHLLLDTGGADAADAQLSPKGANYLSPGQRPGSENPYAPCRKP